jgi:predicted alpha/beta-fold hydrolase
MTLNILSYGYDYPFKDPYLATVLATLPEDMAEYEETDYKEIKLDLENGEIPKNLWYLETFRFGLMAQDKKAPLLFLFAGTGSRYNSSKMLTMGRILYNRGFSVILLPTSFDYNYIVSVSKTHAPGFLSKDGQEIYDLMKIILKKIEKKVEYDEIMVTGYSLGGTTSLVVGEIDSREKYFNFKKIVAVNPTVNLYESARLLDNLLDDNIQSEKELEDLLNRIILEILEFSDENSQAKIDENAIYGLFEQLNLEEDELEILIGIAFRLMAIDINYISDLMTKSNVYTDSTKEIKKYQSMSEYYAAINYSNFQNYIERIGYKTYHKLDESLTLEGMIACSSLEKIDSYLKNADNILVMTNEDEIILTPQNLDYLKKTLKGKLKIYPYGGHCGNLFYKENINFMVNYFLEGDEK